MTEQTDLERVGLFEDGPYDTDVTLYRVHDFTTIMGRDEVKEDDPLRLGGPFPIIPGHKLKAATNDWTFAKEFLSLYEGVEYEDPGSWRRKDAQEKKELNLTESGFNSTIASRSMNGKGTYYGTFAENEEHEAFSPEERDKPEDDLKGVPNMLTNPGKKGTGYGYSNICINPYPEYMEDPMFDQLEARREMREDYETRLNGQPEWRPSGPPHDYFDPNPFLNDRDPDGTEETYDFSRLEKDKELDDKLPFIPSNATKKINGNKDVVSPLERFPEYEGDEYKDPPDNVFRTLQPDPEKPIWKPQFGNRSRQNRSVINQNINLRVNSTNFHMW